MKLQQYQSINPKMQFYVNQQPTSSYRTHNIARARNFCLNYVKENKDTYPYFIMMDCDDVNCKKCEPSILKKYLLREDWDALSFNTSPKYYDIWGLSIYPYCFSYNHFENNVKNYDIIQSYVEKKLKQLPEGNLLTCISAFNGFAIYRINKFVNCKSDGKINFNLRHK